MLHAGATPVDYAGLRLLPVPVATETHVPIAHSAVVDMVKYSLGFYGHEVLTEDYGVTPDGGRFFGVLSLRSKYGDYTDTVGLRNSHDKRFPIGISFGSRVFVCDNLAFSGDHVIKRRHTANAKRDLPGLVAEVVEPLQEQRQRQARIFDAYRHTSLTEPQVDHAIMQLYRLGVINVTRISDVLEAYQEPPHDWGSETAWRLFNATTFALSGRVAENPEGTRQLHQVIDGMCVLELIDQPALPGMH
jgi:hypothetical protein